jgi:hypothetical protein
MAFNSKSQLSHNAADYSQVLADARWENYARLVAAQSETLDVAHAIAFKESVGLHCNSERPNEVDGRVAFLRKQAGVDLTEQALTTGAKYDLVHQTLVRVLKSDESTTLNKLIAAKDLHNILEKERKEGAGNKTINHVLTAATIRQIGKEAAGFIVGQSAPVIPLDGPEVVDLASDGAESDEADQLDDEETAKYLDMPARAAGRALAAFQSPSKRPVGRPRKVREAV